MNQLIELRRHALLLREVCRCWSNGNEPALYTEAALLGWRIGRVVGGWLSGHPNIQFHPTRSPLCAAAVVGRGFVARSLRWSRAARTGWLRAQLGELSRRCADIRAVTSSVSINEMLGRHQPSLVSLHRRAGAWQGDSVAPPQRVVESVAPRMTHGSERRYEGENWPFLSI